MWVLILVILVALLAWSGVLWLVLTIDIFDYSIIAIAAMHLGPPIVVVAICMQVQWWRKRRLSHRQKQLEEALQQQYEAERDKQKKSFDDTLRRRRVAVDCRWAAVSDVIEHKDSIKRAFDSEQTRTYASAKTVVDNWPQDSLVPLLKELFVAAPVTVDFPIAFCAASSKGSNELVRLLRATHAQAVQTAGPAPSQVSIFDVIPLSIRGQSIHVALTELFASHPDLPGVIVVAFDSTLLHAPEQNDWVPPDVDQPMSDVEKYLGKPGRALTVLVMTPSVLAAALTKMDSLPDNTAFNVMTPHWARQQISAGMAGWLAQWPKAQRDALVALVPIASLCASATATLSANLLSSRCRQQAALAVADAAINAGLIEPPFVMTDNSLSVTTEPLASADPHDIQNCGWLVHNAGEIAHCGDRLALVCGAIGYYGVEINPVEQANAVVPEFGNCGEAARWLWLALAMQHATALRQHVVLAEFDADMLRISFVVATLT